MADFTEYGTECMVTYEEMVALVNTSYHPMKEEKALQIMALTAQMKQNELLADLGRSLSSINRQLAMLRLVNNREVIEDATDQVTDQLSNIERTLFDTLGSAKTGEALDAIAKIPEGLHDIALEDSQ